MTEEIHHGAINDIADFTRTHVKRANSFEHHLARLVTGWKKYVISEWEDLSESDQHNFSVKTNDLRHDLQKKIEAAEKSLKELGVAQND